MNWELQEKSFIFGLDKNILSQQNITRVYLFDLDLTLIKTKSGKKFPTSKTDWEFLNSQVITKLNKLAQNDNYAFGIISNQKGLKTLAQITDWEDKLNQVAKQIKIHWVFASVSDDRFRKPMCGSYEYIKSRMTNIDWEKLNAQSQIYYIGDAFGRKDDFSDTDIKYAINCGFKPKTPEIFFGIEASSEHNAIITYPAINYFDKVEQDNWFKIFDDIIKSNSKVLIMTIGLPASGKSFFRKELIKRYPQFSYSNNDDLNDKVLSRNLIKKITPSYDFVIDDNTNVDKIARNAKLKQFESHYKVGVWFDYDLELCWHLNWMRMYWFGGKLLPKVTYYTLNKKFDQTDLNKEFDKFVKVDKVFGEFNLNNQMQYYF